MFVGVGGVGGRREWGLWARDGKDGLCERIFSTLDKFQCVMYRAEGNTSKVSLESSAMLA